MAPSSSKTKHTWSSVWPGVNRARNVAPGTESKTSPSRISPYARKVSASATRASTLGSERRRSRSIAVSPLSRRTRLYAMSGRLSFSFLSFAESSRASLRACATPPTWSRCQCVSKMPSSSVTPSAVMAARRFATNAGLPSPVSRSHRRGPVPIRYAFVPCSVNAPGLPPSTRTTRGESRATGCNAGRPRGGGPPRAEPTNAETVSVTDSNMTPTRADARRRARGWTRPAEAPPWRRAE